MCTCMGQVMFDTASYLGWFLLTSTRSESASIVCLAVSLLMHTHVVHGVLPWKPETDASSEPAKLQRNGTVLSIAPCTHTRP